MDVTANSLWQRDSYRHPAVNDRRLAMRVLDLVRRYENGLEILSARSTTAAESSESWSVHAERTLRAVAAGQTLHFVLPAFPAKSPNREKTDGFMPDFGEVLALRRLDTICREIEAIYAPGARITICSDGRVFSDLVSVEDAAVSRYSGGIERIIERFGFSHLETFHLDHVFESTDFDEMRGSLTTEFGQSLEDVRARVQADLSARWLFNGIHRFLFEDSVVLHPGKSRDRVRRDTKPQAYEMLRRSDAWSRVVESHFPDAVRLSIHPQLPGSAKLGIRLLESSDIWRTPWHAVALEENGVFKLVRRSEAIQTGARLTGFAGEYAYYTLDHKSSWEGVDDFQD